MHITFLHQWFDPEPGTMRGLPLAEYLVEAGHTVEVFCGTPNYPGGRVYEGYSNRMVHRSTKNGVTIFRLGLVPSHSGNPVGRMANYLSFYLSMRAWVPRLIGPADVVFAYHPTIFPSAVAAHLKATAGIPFVMHVSDMWPESVVDSPILPGWIHQAADRWLGRICSRAYDAADSISVLSDEFAATIAERASKPVKTLVVPNWADESLYSRPGDGAGWRREHQIDDQVFLVMYAGNLGAFQELDVLLDAVESLGDRPDIEVVLVGTGTEERRLRQRTAMMSNARVIERQPADRMPDMLAAADVQYVGLADDQFLAGAVPGKLAGIMASGSGVVAACRGAAARLIAESGAGAVSAPGDARAVAAAIMRIASDPSQLSEMQSAAKHYYKERLSFRVGASAMESLLVDAAADHRR